MVSSHAIEWLPVSNNDAESVQSTQQILTPSRVARLMRQNRLGRPHPGIEQTETTAQLPEETGTTKSDSGAGASAGVGGAATAEHAQNTGWWIGAGAGAAAGACAGAGVGTGAGADAGEGAGAGAGMADV